MHTDLSKNEDATWCSYWPVGVKLVMFTPHFVLKIIVMYNVQKMFESLRKKDFSRVFLRATTEQEV